MIILIAIILYILYTDYLKKKQVSTTPAGTDAIVMYSPQPDRTRLYLVAGTIIALYAISFSWLSFGWYRGIKKSRFHWFDDRQEWLQIDKAGHIFGSYFETVWAYELLRWSGMDNKRAAITSAFVGFGFMGSIEGWDGVSAKWGASWSDLVADAIGCSLAMVQYLLWEEQRLMVKYSYNPGAQNYPPGELSERADDLFGKTDIERALKDYNNLTVWLSVNPSKFIPAIKPDWLCLSVGYAAENLYGGFENKWTDENGVVHDRTDLLRTRILKLSLDADLPRLRKNDPTGKALFKVANVIKMPFPSYKIKLEESRQVRK